MSDYHKRRLAERMEDPEFKRAYEGASTDPLSQRLRDYADEKVWEKETKPWARTVPDYLLRGAADQIERLRTVVEAVRDMRGAAVAGGFLTAYDLWWEAVLDALQDYEQKSEHVR